MITVAESELKIDIRKSLAPTTGKLIQGTDAICLQTVWWLLRYSRQSFLQKPKVQFTTLNKKCLTK